MLWFLFSNKNFIYSKIYIIGRQNLFALLNVAVTLTLCGGWRWSGVVVHFEPSAGGFQVVLGSILVSYCLFGDREPVPNSAQKRKTFALPNAQKIRPESTAKFTTKRQKKTKNYDKMCKNDINSSFSWLCLTRD